MAVNTQDDILPVEFKQDAFDKFTEGERRLDPISYLALKEFLENARQNPANLTKAKDDLTHPAKIEEFIEKVRQRELKNDEDLLQEQESKIRRKLEPIIEQELNAKGIDQIRIIVEKILDCQRSEGAQNKERNAEHTQMLEDMRRKLDAANIRNEQMANELQEVNKSLSSANVLNAQMVAQNAQIVDQNANMVTEQSNLRKAVAAADKKATLWAVAGIIIGLAGAVFGVLGYFHIGIGIGGVLIGGVGAAAAHFGLIPIHRTTLASAVAKPQAQAQNKDVNTPTREPNPDPDVEASPVFSIDEKAPSAANSDGNILDIHRQARLSMTLHQDKSEVSCARPKYKKFSINKRAALSAIK
jgi:hypothetical protein